MDIERFAAAAWRSTFLLMSTLGGTRLFGGSAWTVNAQPRELSPSGNDVKKSTGSKYARRTSRCPLLFIYLLFIVDSADANHIQLEGVAALGALAQ